MRDGELNDDERKLMEQRWEEYAGENKNHFEHPLRRATAKRAFEWAYKAAIHDEREQWESARPQFEDGQP